MSLARTRNSPHAVLQANTCAHFAAPFAEDIENAGLMKCSLHNATLDPATMTYKSGPSFMAGMGTKIEPGVTRQPEYAVTMNADGSATLVPPPTPQGGGCSVC